MVTMSGQIANELLAGYLANRDHVVLMDLGIGTAQQEVALLKLLHQHQALPRKLTVIAIEPGQSSLQEAEHSLKSTSQFLGLSIEVIGFLKAGEELTEADWSKISDVVGSSELVVNSAFAAHHIQSNGNGAAVARDEVFARIKALDPTVFVLVEPNSDHFHPDFFVRYKACWRHFHTMFDYIDRLAIPERDKSAMKLFFSREIDDILANKEELRAERHELTSSWVARLQRVGFRLFGGFPFYSPSEYKGVGIADHGTSRGLMIGEELIVSVIAAKAKEAEWVDIHEAAIQQFRPSSAKEMVSAYHTSHTGSLKVRDIMSTNVETIRMDATLRQAAEIVERTSASDLVVVDGKSEFVGVLSEGDLIRYLLPQSDQNQTDSLLERFELLSINGRVRAPERISDLVITHPIVLSPEDDLMKVADIMVSKQIRRLPVAVNNQIVGTVSRARLCVALLGK